ncbi:MAG: hypothetical protein LBP58_07335 [Azoarcus sp.]|nr:hypothetical protein [Azoarcus sp.]
MKRQYALLTLVSAFSAPLVAHAVDGTSIFARDDARLGAKAQSGTEASPGMTARFGGGNSFSMTAFSDVGKRRTMPNMLAQNTVDANGGIGADVAKGANPREWTASWGAAIGYRHASLDFNIGYDNGLPDWPDVLSELKYDAEMNELRVNGDWKLFNGLVVTGEAAYAYGFSGDSRDSDYASSGRRDEFSRSYAKTHGSTARRLALGAGWRIPLPTRRIGVTPLAGYAYQYQDWRVRHGRQAVSEPGLIGGDHVPPPVGRRLHGLDSHYKPSWHGPWLGVQLDANLARQFDLRFGLKHQWSRYYAEGEWNLRRDLKKTGFKHHGDSKGWQTEIGAIWRFLPHNALSFTLDWGEQRLTNGSERKFFSDGTTSKIRLNEVNAESWGASLGYRMDF